MAQAIGGRYGLPHGALNAICLPPALRFNEAFVPDALLEGRAADRAEELARLAGFTTLSALGVPRAGPARDRGGCGRSRGRPREPSPRLGRRRAGAADAGLLATRNQ